jgi:hypothetical protein
MNHVFSEASFAQARTWLNVGRLIQLLCPFEHRIRSRGEPKGPAHRAGSTFYRSASTIRQNGTTAALQTAKAMA